jgi:hypothetical protein
MARSVPSRWAPTKSLGPAVLVPVPHVDSLTYTTECVVRLVEELVLATLALFCRCYWSVIEPVPCRIRS